MISLIISVLAIFSALSRASQSSINVVIEFNELIMNGSFKDVYAVYDQQKELIKNFSEAEKISIFEALLHRYKETNFSIYTDFFNTLEYVTRHVDVKLPHELASEFLTCSTLKGNAFVLMLKKIDDIPDHLVHTAMEIDFSIVPSMIEAGGNPNSVDSDGVCLLSKAIKRGANYVGILMDLGANPNFNGGAPMKEACRLPNFALRRMMVLKLLEYGADPINFIQ